MVKIAEAQSAAGWALAAGAVFLPVLAFGCVGDGHRVFVCFAGRVLTPRPLLFANYSGISSFAVFRPQFQADKGFKPCRISRIEPVAWNPSHAA
jgi:hypothetical protein